MEINISEQKKVNAKSLNLYLKVSDGFTAGLYDESGKELKDYDGYVPSFMPGQHYGDYVILNIDIDSGQITNWPKIDPREIEKFISGEDDE